MLTITPMPKSHLAPEDHSKANNYRFECRTCPYQMVLDRRYYERKEFEFKNTEDVLGGAEAWANVDKTESKLNLCTSLTSCLVMLISPISQMCERSM